MRLVIWQPAAIAEEIDKKTDTVIMLLEMINSDKYTHADKRKIAHTARLVIKQMVNNLVSDDSDREIPF